MKVRKKLWKAENSKNTEPWHKHVLEAINSLGKDTQAATIDTQGGKNLFELDGNTLPFFQALHAVVESKFKPLLITQKKLALTQVREQLNKDTDLLRGFSDTLASFGHHQLSGTEEFFSMTVKQFLKSKQKQMIRDCKLAPSKTSTALRAGLRTKPAGKESDTRSKPASSGLQEQIASKNVEGVHAELAKISTNDMTLTCKEMTVTQLKAALKLLNKPYSYPKDTLVTKLCQFHKDMQQP